MRITLRWMLAGLALASAALAAAPKTVVIDGQRLVAAKTQITAKDKTYINALGLLTAQADSWLSQGPWSVTNKAKPPPGGTINDFGSQAPYYWPNPNTANGCPWVNRDRQWNPESDKYPDRVWAFNLFNSTYTLSLAWYYTGDRKYSSHAVQILRTWFINKTTAMTPNMNHAQFIPCGPNGREYGVIEFSQQYPDVLDAVAILSGSSDWTSADDAAFRSCKFLTWLTTSSLGKKASALTNNHGTFAGAQITALANFMGNTTVATSTAKSATKLIDSQIKSDGSQPQELGRTRSWHYSNFNLVAHLRWVLSARKLGVDLFAHTVSQNQTIFKAVEYLLPAAVGGQSSWNHPELEFHRYAATYNVHSAALEGLAAASRTSRSFRRHVGETFLFYGLLRSSWTI